LSIGLKKGLDVTLNAGSTVIAEGKSSNRGLIPKISIATKYTHELSVSYVGGLGIKYTHDNANPGEVNISAGALGFLGGSVSYDTNGHLSNWFIGIDIDVHLAVSLGIEGEYKLGFGK